ncbi:MAG: hypothetical protein QNJ17_03945 [Desulfocapsaceae bacterium]|nr:hypothetical protein [Desulfocapsaceae bacterium]
MKTLETLYFPDTAILTERQLPLFLLFEKVNLLAPVEDDFSSSTKKPDTFMDSRFCQVHTPYPLGEDRQRFLYLINDIQNRKDDYAAQLSNITLASMSERKGTGDDAKYQIVSSLLGRDSSGSEDSNDQHRDLLWQARLVLKIGEMLDKEEEEVARSLVNLDESEADLFTRLKGEDDEDDDLVTLYSDIDKIKTKLDRPRTDTIGKRLRAWFRFAGGADLPICPVWSTTRQEVADILFTNHDKKHQHEPEILAALHLPTILDLSEKRVEEALTEFHEAARDLLPPILAQLSETSRTPNSEEVNSWEETLKSWQNFLDTSYPEEQFGRISVSFYRFKEPLAHYSGIDELVEGVVSPHILAVFAK